MSCWTQTSFETAKEGPHRHKQRCLISTHKLQFLPLWQIYQCFFWARPLHYCISFILITEGSIKVSLSFSIINNCASRLEFKAQYSTRTPPQAGQVPFLQFSSLWCWGQTKWYVCHTPLPLEQNLVLLLQLNSAGFLSRNAKWNQCLGFPGWAWRSQPLYHFSALSFLFLSLSLRASNWHTADWKQHASQGSRCTILQPFGAPFLSLWPFFFCFFNLQISFVCVLQNCKPKALNTYKYEKAIKHKGEQSWSWQLPVRHLCLILLVDTAGLLIPQLPQNKYCVPLDLIRHSACAQEIQKQHQDFKCSGSSKLLATHKNPL